MKFRVLRNCFVGGRYYPEGVIWDLPDDLEKSPKNFKPVDGDIPSEELPLYVSDKPYKSKRKKIK